MRLPPTQNEPVVWMTAPTWPHAHAFTDRRLEHAQNLRGRHARAICGRNIPVDSLREIDTLAWPACGACAARIEASA